MRKTVGWHVNPETGKTVQEQITIGYAATRAEGLQMLAEYNNNPFEWMIFIPFCHPHGTVQKCGMPIGSAG